MIADHGSPSWKLKCIFAEVGCRGCIPPSFRKALQRFGFTLKGLKTLVDECSLVSSGSNYYIWFNSFHQTFIPFQMVKVDIDSYQSIAVALTSMVVSLAHIFLFVLYVFLFYVLLPSSLAPPLFFLLFYFYFCYIYLVFL